MTLFLTFSTTTNKRVTIRLHADRLYPVALRRYFACFSYLATIGDTDKFENFNYFIMLPCKNVVCPLKYPLKYVP